MQCGMVFRSEFIEKYICLHQMMNGCLRFFINNVLEKICFRTIICVLFVPHKKNMKIGGMLFCEKSV